MTGVMSELETVAAPDAPAAVPPADPLPAETLLAETLLAETRACGAAALLTRSGLALRLMKALAECLLAAELKQHMLRADLPVAARSGNCRNGSTPKTVTTPAGKLELAVPRVRHATFVPRLVPRYQRSMPGFDHNILVLYRRGVTVPELQSHLMGLYGEQAWAELGGTLTGAVLQHVQAWQARHLAPACDLLYFGTLRVRPAPGGQAGGAALYFALGVRAAGCKDILGFWTAGGAQGAPWGAALRELRERGLAEPATIAGAGLPGLREAAAQVYPAARLRTAP